MVTPTGFVDGPVNGSSASLIGKPAFVDPFMPAMAAGAEASPMVTGRGISCASSMAFASSGRSTSPSPMTWSRSALSCGWMARS